MYNTGNPIGSTSPKDFSDNAEITDRYVNDVVNETTQDRFGRSRLTIHGIEKKADAVFASLGFLVPVDYTPGLTVDSRNFTTTYNGVVYAAQPSAVPFTTGAWDAAQWYPIQNVLNQKNLLVFDTYAEASAAAATLPDGQEVLVRDVKSIYEAQSASLVFKDFIPDSITLQNYGELADYTGISSIAEITESGKSGSFINRGVVPSATALTGIRIIDALGRLWERDVTGKIDAAWCIPDGGTLLDGVNTALASRIGAPVTAVGEITGVINLGQFDLLDGEKARASHINGSVVTTGSFSEIRGYQITPPNDTTFAITTTNSAEQDYYGSVKDIRVVGQNGLDASATEMLVENFRVLGKGSDLGGTALKINNWDMSLRNFYCEEVRYGIITSNGVQGVDVHIVRAEIAVALSSNGHPAQLNQLYLDGPKKHGVAFFDMSNATINGVQVLRVGRFWPTPGEATAFFFDSTSRHNKISNVNFTQDDLTTTTGLIQLSETATNNVFANFGGSYKMADPHASRLRNQTFYGGTGGWAKHNNLTRKCRARGASVAAGASVDLVFTLDWDYPIPSFNFFLFKGTWASRAANNDAAYGTIHTFIENGTIGLASDVNKIAGASGIGWAVTAKTLSGNQLTLTLQNTGTATASISIELERSVDPGGVSF